MVRERGIQVFRFIFHDPQAHFIDVSDEHVIVSFGETYPVSPIVDVRVAGPVGRLHSLAVLEFYRARESRRFEKLGEFVFSHEIILVEISGDYRRQLVAVRFHDHFRRLDETDLPVEENGLMMHVSVHYFEITERSLNRHFEKSFSSERLRYRRIQEATIRDKAAAYDGEFGKNDQSAGYVEQFDEKDAPVVFRVAGDLIFVLEFVAQKGTVIDIKRFLKADDVGIRVPQILCDASYPLFSVLDEPERQIPNIEGDNLYLHVTLW